jgi:hypothetical protein
MKTAIAIAIPMGLSAAVAAADKPPRASTAARQPLHLRIGDVRNYMTRQEYDAAMNAPDADRYVIVVEGRRQSAEVRSLRAVPMGLGAVAWSFRHPASAWRIFAPDVNAPPPRPVLTKVPPPVFRPGP